MCESELQCSGFCFELVLAVLCVVCACVHVCRCVCVWRSFTGNNAGQNLPTIDNKRCLRSMSGCPRISAAGAERVQSASKGQPILECHVFYLHQNPVVVFGSCGEIHHRNSS